MLQEWWAIAQVAGAGAAVVLGPVCYVLWRQHVADVRYQRESEKKMLEVLGGLTRLLEEDSKDDEKRFGQLSAELAHNRDAFTTEFSESRENLARQLSQSRERILEKVAELTRIVERGQGQPPRGDGDAG